jgi:predicted rRNA methylase YqxC with S4 and FtsJ domains
MLLKPQFEILELPEGTITPQQRKSFTGVIEEASLAESVQHSVLETLKPLCQEQGWFLEGTTLSPITGTEGNREFLVYLKTQ